MYKLPEDIESKYRFVTLASKRAEQLQTGAVPRVEEAETKKWTVIAQEEVATGLVDLWTPEDEEALEASDEVEEE
jgi:DNA-directed RNA polymerase omega subunit